MQRATLPRERHLTIVPDPPPRTRPATDRAAPDRVLIDVALFWPRLWLRPFGYRLRVERRDRPLPAWWRGE